VDFIQTSSSISYLGYGFLQLHSIILGEIDSSLAFALVAPLKDLSWGIQVKRGATYGPSSPSVNHHQLDSTSTNDKKTFFYLMATLLLWTHDFIASITYLKRGKHRHLKMNLCLFSKSF